MPEINPRTYPGWVMGGERADVLAGDGFYYRPRQVLFEAGLAVVACGNKPAPGKRRGA